MAHIERGGQRFCGAESDGKKQERQDFLEEACYSSSPSAKGIPTWMGSSLMKVVTVDSQAILHLLGKVEQQVLIGSLGHLVVRLHYVLVVVR